MSGALWWKQLVELCKEIGFSTPRLITASTLELKKEEFHKVLGKKLVTLFRAFYVIKTIKYGLKVNCCLIKDPQ